MSEHGCVIAPSTYYDNLSRGPSKRSLRDRQLLAVMRAERDRQKLIKPFGARTTWLHLRGRGQTWLAAPSSGAMASRAGPERYGSRDTGTTVASRSDQRAADRVERDFAATAPNQLWVADFTYVAAFSSTVYGAFGFDVFARMIVGWRAATSMSTDLVLETLEMTIWNLTREGITDLTGLIHHNDAGSQSRTLR